MVAARSGKKSWLDVYPIEKLKASSPGDILFVDVGGGKGHEVAALAERQKGVEPAGKLVLQDRADVISQVPEDWRDVFTCLEHDFFTPQPVMCQRAHTYYLRNVLHDWPDKECIDILSHLRDAMKPGYSKLLINEIVFADSKLPFWYAAFDISMMAAVSGRERTKSEWEQLLAAVPGLRIEKIWQLEENAESVIEVIRESDTSGIPNAARYQYNFVC
jgi:hypothetical protein